MDKRKYVRRKKSYEIYLDFFEQGFIKKKENIFRLIKRVNKFMEINKI